MNSISKETILFLSIGLSFVLVKASAQQFAKSNAQIYKSKFDNHLEQIEKSLKIGDYTRTCKEASHAARIIKTNIEDLKRLEPDYNWADMNNLLMTMPSIHCQGATN